jgi:hypothetical protein
MPSAISTANDAADPHEQLLTVQSARTGLPCPVFSAPLLPWPLTPCSPRASRLIGLPVTFKAKGRDGRLTVGPEILRTVLPGDAWRSIFGPYWVVAVGEWLGHAAVRLISYISSFIS